MPSDKAFRRILWIAAAFNLGGALLFAVPGLPPGAMAGLPADAPLVYRAFVALFVLLFGGAYAWLAMQPVIDRPMVAFAAIGKGSAFVLVSVLWLMGQGSGFGVVAAAGDLVFAGLYFAWLRRDA